MVGRENYRGTAVYFAYTEAIYFCEIGNIGLYNRLKGVRQEEKRFRLSNESSLCAFFCDNRVPKLLQLAIRRIFFPPFF